MKPNVQFLSYLTEYSKTEKVRCCSDLSSTRYCGFPRPKSVKPDPAAKPLRGFGGARGFEIVASHHGNAWRAVYTVRFQDAIYALHSFQKNSTKGIATPTREIELIKRRLVGTEAENVKHVAAEKEASS